MTEQELEKLRFPIGPFIWPKNIQQKDIDGWIKILEDFPEKIATLTNDLSKDQLNKQYRPDGWMLKQVVHHCADSHMSAIKRVKLALTEEAPKIRPYPEHLFAELIDSMDDDISHSLAIIQAVHHKWVQVLRNLSAVDFDRSFVHPEYGKVYKLSDATALYAWHCGHHLGHIELALGR